MNEIVFKLLLLGDSTVGKTSLMIRFCDNFYEENKVSNIGTIFKSKEIEINNQKIELNIYDTSGQERYRSLAKNYLRNANGIIFVFDLTNDNTFENITNWLNNCNDVINNYQKILVGNKLDLEDKQIDERRVEKFCSENNMKYFEASAKNGKNVEIIFKEIALLILDDKQKKEKENEMAEQNNNIKIQTHKSKKGKKRC